MTLHIARRGRPPKSASVAPAPVVRPNHEVLEDLKYRFSMLGKLTTGATQSNIRAMVVSGSAGVGKTYTVEHVLEQSGTHYEVVKGTLMALMILLSLLTFFSFADELGDIGKGAYGMKQIFTYLALILPRNFYELLAPAALVGSLVTLGGERLCLRGGSEGLQGRQYFCRGDSRHDPRAYRQRRA